MTKIYTMLMRCQTIGKGGEHRLLSAGKHNLREIGGHSFNPDLSHNNVILAGPDTAQGIVHLASVSTEAAGFTFKRRDATRAAETIFSLAPTTPVDTGAYFRACLTWLTKVFGQEAVLSAVIHYDEAAPHLHVLMLPMKNGKWLASSIFGRKTEVNAMQEAFFKEVAAKFGLAKAPVRLLTEERQVLAQQVLEELMVKSAASTRCQIWPVVRDLIAANPIPFAEQLGLEIPKRRLKTLAELKVSAGKGGNTENSYRSRVDGGSDISLCVDVVEPTHPSLVGCPSSATLTEPGAHTVPVSDGWGTTVTGRDDRSSVHCELTFGSVGSPVSRMHVDEVITAPESISPHPSVGSSDTGSDSPTAVGPRVCHPWPILHDHTYDRLQHECD